jgi:hypothetical protein
VSSTVAERHATPELVLQLVREVRQQLAGHGAAPLVVGVRAQVDWTYGDLDDVAGTVRVVGCATPLAVREALWEQTGADSEAPTTLVILTPLPEADLGADVLGRFVRPRLLYLNSWNAVCQRFGVRQLDPDYGTSGLAWMADALLWVPLDGLPTATTTLSVDAGLLYLARFAFGAGTLTLDGILRATASAGFADRVANVDAELLEHVCTALSERLGPAVELVCGAIRNGYGADAVAGGLAAATVAGAGDAHRAPAMIAALTGVNDAADAALAAWARAAETVILSLSDEGAPRVAELLTAGSGFVTEWRAPHPEASTVLSAGFEARLATLARELDAFLDSTAAADLDSVRNAVATVRAHRDARTSLSRHRAVRAELAARLALWLRDPASDAEGTALATGGASPTFGQVVEGYVADGAWVDTARRRVEEGDDGPPELAAVLSRVAEAAYERRRAGNLRFAAALAQWSGHGTATDVPGESLVAVEALLEQVAVPLAAAERALLVVLDGCGLAPFLELVAQFPSLGFAEIGRAGRRAAGLAALPTVTEVSRSSLLCGELSIGNADHERRHFEANPAVRSLAGPTARLFHHRPHLVTGIGQSLPAEVALALSTSGPQLVAAVVNTIDDELSRGDFTREYAIEHLGPLQALLRAAADAGRFVVVTADHGHVLGVGLDGRGEARRTGEGGDRWRDADRAPDADEVLLRGPRVLLGGDTGVIAPAQDDLRYSAKHGGYHGGATPEECLVPLSVFRPPGVDTPAGWEPVSVAPPGWWDLAAAAVAPDPVAPAPKKRRSKSTPGPSQPGLFDDDQTTPGGTEPTEQPDAPSPSGAEAPWAEQLVTSEAFQLQLEAAKRMNPQLDRVRAALGALDARGGTASFTALAQAAGMPVDRVPGFVSVLERLLNVDGYGVITVDRTTQEVRLDETLLRTQFLEGGS